MKWTYRAAFVLLATSPVATAGDPPKAPTVIGNGMGTVAFLRYSPSGKELVRICQFGGVEMLDTVGYDKIRTFPVGVRMIAFSPDGTRIATAEGTDGARVWDASLPGKKTPRGAEVMAGVGDVSVLETPLHVLETPSSTGSSSLETRADMKRVLRAEFSPDGKRLVTAQAGGHLKVWNTESWSLEAEFATAENELVTIAFAPDGKTVVVGDGEGVLHEWSLEKKAETRTAHAEGAVTEIVFAPDGKTLATVHTTRWMDPSGSSVVFWDAARAVVETKAGWSAVAISKDGKAMAIGGKRVEFVDPTSRKTIRAVELAALSMREASPLLVAALAADGSSGATPDTKIPVAVVALAFSPDGTTLAAGCQDGTVRLVKTAP